MEIADLEALASQYGEPNGKPAQVYAYDGTRQRFELPESIGQGARNDTLMRYAASLKARGRTDEETEVLVREANQTRCEPPLPESEVGTILRSASSWGESEGHRRSREHDEAKSKGRANDGEGQGEKSKLPIHRQVADYLMHECGARYVSGVPVVSDGICYSAGLFEMERRITRRYDCLKKAQRNEAMELVRLEAPRSEETCPRYIGFSNGVLDIRSMELHPEGVPGAVVTNRVPHDWNPDASCPPVDSFLDSVACGDEATRANLEECAGHCLYRGREIQVFWVLTGGGGNGKSAFLELLGYSLGSDNFTALQPDDLAERFQGGEVAGKLAVLADDASSQTISESLSASIKRISAGNVIHSDVKYHSGMDFRPYATLVLCYNRFPTIKSNDYGFMRRLVPVPFNATFRPGTAGFVPNVSSKLCIEGGAERFLLLAVKGLKRLLDNDSPTHNPAAEEMKADIRLDNDTVAAWVESECIGPHDVVGQTTGDEYGKYAEWCEGQRKPPKAQIAFSRGLCRELGLRTKKVRVGNGTTNVYAPLEG